MPRKSNSFLSRHNKKSNDSDDEKDIVKDTKFDNESKLIKKPMTKPTKKPATKTDKSGKPSVSRRNMKRNPGKSDDESSNTSGSESDSEASDNSELSEITDASDDDVISENLSDSDDNITEDDLSDASDATDDSNISDSDISNPRNKIKDEENCVHDYIGNEDDALEDMETDKIKVHDLTAIDYFKDYNIQTNTVKYHLGEDRITKPYLFDYERIKLLSVRTKQLSSGAKSFIKDSIEMPAKQVAQLEMDYNVLPLMLERPLPNGECDLYKVSELIKL